MNFVESLLTMSGTTVQADAQARLTFAIGNPALKLFGLPETLDYEAILTGPFDKDEDGFPEFEVDLWAGRGEKRIKLLSKERIELDPALVVKAAATMGGGSKELAMKLIETAGAKLIGVLG